MAVALVILVVAWIAVVAIVVAACTMAARGDRADTVADYIVAHSVAAPVPPRGPAGA